jgi:hypothetical protein
MQSKKTPAGARPAVSAAAAIAEIADHGRLAQVCLPPRKRRMGHLGMPACPRRRKNSGRLGRSARCQKPPSSRVCEDVDQPPEGITHVKPPHAPMLNSRTILDCNACARYPSKCFVQIINLDRDIRNGSSGATFHRNTYLRRHLRWSCKRGNPALVHDDF